MSPWEKRNGAEDLAERRGCDPVNPCWEDCVEVAMEEVSADDTPADQD